MIKTVLAIVSHPDDAEFLCAGTLALLGKNGWHIEIATVTPGDKGSAQHDRSRTAEIRKTEAQKAADLLGAGYHCLECEDFLVFHDRPTILKATELIRKLRPTLVFTMSPSCYHVDHEVTSKVVRAACFGGGIPNLETGAAELYDHIPHLYYLDPMEGKDLFGKPVKPHMIIDISSVIDLKEQMLACHESQREWLKDHHGVDHYLVEMREFSQQRGKQIGVGYGEGFRQHLGHSFPQDNLLKEALADRVHIL